MKLNESQLRYFVKQLINEIDVLEIDCIDEEDELEEISVVSSIAGVTTPLGTGPTYPTDIRKKTKKRQKMKEIKNLSFDDKMSDLDSTVLTFLDNFYANSENKGYYPEFSDVKECVGNLELASDIWRYLKDLRNI